MSTVVPPETEESATSETPEAGEESIRDILNNDEDFDRGQVREDQRQRLFDSKGEIEAEKSTEPDKESTDEQPKSEKAESKEDKAEAETEEEITDWTLGGRFKSEVDLAKSYKELEKKFTPTAQELKEIKRKFEDQGITPQDGLGLWQWYQNEYAPWREAKLAEAKADGQAKGKTVKKDSEEKSEEAPKNIMDMDREELLTAIEEDPKIAVPKLVVEYIRRNPSFFEENVPELAAARTERKITEAYLAIEGKYDDTEQVFPVMTEIFKANPKIRKSAMHDAEVMDNVYWMAKGRMSKDLAGKYEDAMKKAVDKAKEDALSGERKKVKASVEGMSQSIEPGQSGVDKVDDWTATLNYVDRKRVKI